ncbi:MAG TPA: methylenetetrahydrofolate--tRNA-(uracil(54)-C(5))-methyltransferase (FADH(2)-oxidizing) TrmFO [Acholeplasmataceae bacterium]|jgi:methylenetetrahydrofolate--tRNA-(uracil-5-)-methyltransferase|nr:methylenetetrahydrofolate--tRNA-(uracil(54)-C(5))-methyltransferase (FADH(2)-oxidizing) TrmFO [Acholeplasmataceae bacterium]
MRVKVIGAGLAGSEATYQLVKQGIKVDLYEMRGVKNTEAHETTNFSELVCSNSLRSNDITNAVGLLKEELRELDSLIMKSADKNQIEAGTALAVDRNQFSLDITNYLKNHPLVTFHNEEVVTLDDSYTIIATGPLTSEEFSLYLKKYLNQDDLYFFDAVAPIVLESSIDKSKAYLKNRYDKGEASYYNCPLTEEEYDVFYQTLIEAEKVKPKDFERKVFEACVPIEDLAARGKETLLFGPLKPVGLEDPKTGQMPYAVVQLRPDDASKSLYNLVGFQTSLKFGEQKKIINLIPGLEKAEIMRYGVMHRNTYINSPKVLNSFYQLKSNPKVFFAGQITGVEGYVESTASGLLVGLNLGRLLNGKEMIKFSRKTALGALASYIAIPNSNFQPMNINFGIIDDLERRAKKAEKRELIAERSLSEIRKIKEKIND